MHNNYQWVSSNRLFMIASLLLILIGLGGVQFLIHDELSDDRELREQTTKIQSTRDRLAEFLEIHLEAETGVRGYVLTGNGEFLAPYEDALERRERVLEVLETGSDNNDKPAFANLRRLSELKIENARTNVLAVAAGSSEQARRRVGDGEGLALMEAIRLQVGRLDAAEAEILSQLERASETKRRDVERFIAVLLVGIAALLVAATLVIGHATSQRRAALMGARSVAEQERAMFDGAVDGMLLLDETGNILRTNPSVERMFGYSAVQLQGQSNMFLMAEPFSNEQSYIWLTRIGRAGVDGAGRRQEFIGKRADGTTFETEVAVSRVGEDGDTRFVAAIRDISHRKRAERLKNEFVSTVSHELRTPLTSIGGSLALLDAGAVGEINERAARLVSIARSNCERLIRLINDLLDIEKIESGKMSFDMRKLPLASLIQRTISANQQFADDHEVKLEVTLPPWPQCVQGDPDRLEQVLTNLVSNAIKYSPKNETVNVTTKQRGGIVRIEVSDCGEGVPQDFRDRIFSKFAMADNSDARKRGGTGLGLAIVREIASRHGGEAGFEDRESGGSTFYVELPLLKEEPVQIVADSDLPALLYIDDDLDCQSVVASAFANHATLISANTIEQARAILGSQKSIRGCILDVALGNESGLDLLPQLRIIAPDLPVVIFTALDEPHAEARANAVLVKSRTPITTLVETTMALVARQTRKEQ